MTRSLSMCNVHAFACVALVMWTSAACHAQPYPSKPIRLMMPYPAGGSTDIVGRLIAERLTAALKQAVVVENRPGASAQIGTEAAAKAPADGYTLLMATSTNAINQALNPNLPYDFPKEFQPIALIANAGQVLVVHPSLPARSVREFIALAKARPGQLAYASSGAGTSGHLAMEALSSAAKIKLLHVPYKGNAPALNDLLGGQVTCGFANVVSVLPQVKAGRLRVLGISSVTWSWTPANHPLSFVVVQARTPSITRLLELFRTRALHVDRRDEVGDVDFSVVIHQIALSAASRAEHDSSVRRPSIRAA